MEKFMVQTEFYNLCENAFPFWSELADTDKQFLYEHSKRRKFRKGQTIHDGEECTGVILVNEGCLRLYMMSEEGKDISLYRLFSGDVCMLSASCALKSITFDVLVDADEESDCVVIAGAAFAELSNRVQAVQIYALETTAARFSDVMWLMQQILFMSFDRRLAIFLLDECAKNGTDTVKMTHEQIAKYMGSAREVVSRMLKHFVREGLVEVSRGGVKIPDKRRLRAMT